MSRGLAMALKRARRRAAGLVLRQPAALATIVIAPAFVLGSLAGYAVARAGPAQPPYRLLRLQAAAEALAPIRGDYVLAAGDSHAERWPARRLCGLPVVNAGLSGATATSYDAFVAALKLPRLPRAVVLTIGTNDAQTRRLHEPEALRPRFEAGLLRLLSQLAPAGGLVLMTGPPPLGQDGADAFSPAALAAIAEASAAVCDRTAGCVREPPFPPGLAMSDGVHFDDYELAYRALEAPLCRRIAQTAGAEGP